MKWACGSLKLVSLAKSATVSHRAIFIPITENSGSKWKIISSGHTPFWPCIAQSVAINAVLAYGQNP